MAEKKTGRNREKSMNENDVNNDHLLRTKTYEKWKETEDLYSIPATAVPGCGYMLGYLLKREGIYRASQLYAEYQNRKEDKFAKWLTCKFGAWNNIYTQTIITALKEWEDRQKARKEKHEQQNQKKGTHIVGPGSKKWKEFMEKKDLNKTSVKTVPGIGETLGNEMCNRGVKTAQQLRDTWKTQCKEDEKNFTKWISCIFGYWNSQYTKTVLDALKAYDDEEKEESEKNKKRDGKKGKKTKDESGDESGEDGDTEEDDTVKDDEDDDQEDKANPAKEDNEKAQPQEYNTNRAKDDNGEEAKLWPKGQTSKANARAAKETVNTDQAEDANTASYERGENFDQTGNNEAGQADRLSESFTYQATEGADKSAAAIVDGKNYTDNENENAATASATRNSSEVNRLTLKQITLRVMKTNKTQKNATRDEANKNKSDKTPTAAENINADKNNSNETDTESYTDTDTDSDIDIY